MGSRVLDAHVDGICDPNYFDGSGVRFLTTAYDSIGIQTWGTTPKPPKGQKRRTSTSFYRYQRKLDGPHGVVDYYPTLQPGLYHRLNGLLDQYSTWNSDRCASLYDIEMMRNFAENAAIASALKKAKDQKTHFGQAIGEYKQTAGTGKWAGGVGKRSLDGLVNLIGVVGGMASDAKRGNLAGVLRRAGLARSDFDRFKRSQRRKRSLHGISDAYLGFIYGVKPLMGDIYGALQSLAELNAPKDFIHKVSAGYSDSYSETWTEHIGLGNAWSVSFLRETQVRAKCSFRFVVEDDFVHTMSSAGITNVAHTAWELTTLSFVFDWFINVGDFLSNLDATRGLGFLDGTLSSLVRIKVLSKAEGRSGQSWTYDGLASGYAEAMMLSRTPLTGFPSQSRPVMKWPTNLQHAITAVALVVQRLR